MSIQFIQAAGWAIAHSFMSYFRIYRNGYFGKNNLLRPVQQFKHLRLVESNQSILDQFVVCA